MELVVEALLAEAVLIALKFVITRIVEWYQGQGLAGVVPATP